MNSLGDYLIRNRLQAIGAISFLSLLTLLVPVFVYPLSGVVLSLLTLRRGARVSLQVIAGCLLLTTVLCLLFRIMTEVAVVFAVFIWLPVFCCAISLRLTCSQGWMVVTAGMIGTAILALLYSYWGGAENTWQAVMEAAGQAGMQTGQLEEYREITADVIPLLNVLVAALIVVNLVLTTLLARWWQSILYNPGGFKPEFNALRVPRGLLYPTLGGIIMLLILGEDQYPLLRDLLIIILFVYLFQGVSSIHRIVNRRNLSVLWLVSMYSLLVLLPHMVLFMALIGMADSLFGGRKKNV